MEQHEDTGTKKDLVMYRLEAAKENLNSAKILLDADSYKAANNRAYYDDFYIATRSEAGEQIATADEFIQAAEKYCLENL